MKILGFNLTKINAEIISNRPANLNVDTNLDISDISPAELSMMKSEEKLLVVKFTHSVSYSPDFAKIEFGGSLVVSTDEKMFNEVIDQWKDKKIPEGFKIGIFNIIIKKSSLKALQLEEELGLPTHIPLPTVRAPEEKLKDSNKEDSSEEKKD